MESKGIRHDRSPVLFVSRYCPPLLAHHVRSWLRLFPRAIYHRRRYGDPQETGIRENHQELATEETCQGRHRVDLSKSASLSRRLGGEVAGASWPRLTAASPCMVDALPNSGDRSSTLQCKTENERDAAYPARAVRPDRNRDFAADVILSIPRPRHHEGGLNHGERI